MKKPVLYIIHGWTYTVAPWERTIALLEKQGIKVEMLHVPGLTTQSKKVWTIDEYVDWADRNIPDGAVALGHSNGGRILLNLCSRKPDKLQHLILLDAAGVYEESSRRDIARTLSKRLSFLKKIPGLTRIWHKLTGATDYAKAPENMKQTLSNMLESDKKLDLSKVTVPTSIIWGLDDNVTPPRQAEVMHEKITDSTLDMHVGWAHAPYLTHPADLAKAILRAYKKPPEKKPTPELDPEVTKTAEVSASMALKKAAEPVLPNLKDRSASMAFKKAAGPTGTDVAKNSASLAMSANKKPTESIVENLKGVEYEKANLDLPPRRQVITSASVPKISRLEKMKRAAKRKQTARKINKAKQKEAKAAMKATKVAKSAKNSTRKSAKTTPKSAAKEKR